MPDQMTEAPRPPEPQPASREILRPEYYGIYGRLLLATQPGQDLKKVLDPDNAEVGDGINILLPRDYNPITEKLSSSEREAAWRGVDRDQAYAQWRTRFTAAVKTWNTEEQLKALHLVSGKLAADFSETDTDDLYNDFCRGGSDTTAFVRHLVDKAPKDGDGKIDPVYLETIAPQLKWLASKFFGSETSNIVERIVELEAGINNEGEDAVNKVIADPEKVKTLSDPEKNLLRPLLTPPATPISIAAPTAVARPESPTATAAEVTPPSTTEVPAAPPAPTTPEQQIQAAQFAGLPKEEKIRVLHEAIATIRKGETPINPQTGYPLVALSQDHAINQLRQQIQAISNEPDTTSAGPTPAGARPDTGSAGAPLEEGIFGKTVIKDGKNYRVSGSAWVGGGPQQYMLFGEGNTLSISPEDLFGGDWRFEDGSTVQPLPTPAVTNTPAPTTEIPAAPPSEDDDRDDVPAGTGAGTPLPTSPDGAEQTPAGVPTTVEAPRADEPETKDIVAQVLSPDNKTPDGESYILPKEWFTHEGLDFSQAATNPQFQEFIKSLSERVSSLSFPSQVRLSQSFSAEELQEADPQWLGLDFGIFIKSEWDANDLISLNASMKHSRVPEAERQNWTQQSYRDLETHLEEAFGNKVSFIDTVDDERNTTSLRISWRDDSIRDKGGLDLRLSPDGISVSSFMINPGNVASSVNSDLTGNTGELAFQRFFSVLNALTPLMRQPAFTEAAPPSEDDDRDDVPAGTGVGAQPPTIPADPTPSPAEAEQPRPEKEPIPLVYSREKGLTGFADTMTELLEDHLDEQNVVFATSKDILPHLLPLVLRDLLENPENPGEVDIGIDGKPIIKNVTLKNGHVQRFSVSNSEDGKGLEFKTFDGEAGNDITETLPHINEATIQVINTVMKDRLRQWGIYRIYLKSEGEGEAKDVRVIIEAIPEGESRFKGLDQPDATQPAVAQEAPPQQPSAPDEPAI